MDQDDPLNRREFISLGALGTLGTVTQHVLGQPLLPEAALIPVATQSPSPSASPTPVTQPPEQPGAPEVVNFANDDFTTRGSTFLVLRWDSAARADRYEVRFVRAGSDVVKTVVSNQERFEDLLPSQDYSITVRGLNSVGPSEWSPPLAVCTRPSQPPPPMQGYNQMIQVSNDMLILWELSILPGTTVRLDKRRAGDAPRILSQSPDARGQFVDTEYAVDDRYALSLMVQNPLAPGGVNRSQRSDEIRPLRMVFAELQLPGEDDTRQTKSSYLRDYYA